MSSEKPTEYYHLHQWALSEPVRLAEVNENFAALDSAVAQAQGAADTLPYVVGTYTGDGTTSNKVALPFHPSLLIIHAVQYTTSSTTTNKVAVFPSDGYAKFVTIEDDGFTILSTSYYPRINTKGTTYVYIAFR
jgi:hypothetical protein